MSTPVEELSDPFADYAAVNVTASPAHNSPKLISTNMSSAEGSRPESRSGDKPKDNKKKRVGFGEDPRGRSARNSFIDMPNRGRALSPPPPGKQDSPEASGKVTPVGGGLWQPPSSGDALLTPRDESNKSLIPDLSPQQTAQIYRAFDGTLPRPRPAIRRSPSDNGTPTATIEEEIESGDEQGKWRKKKAQEAFERGKRLEQSERFHSDPNSREVSPERKKFGRSSVPELRMDNIPLRELKRHRNESAIMDDDDDEYFPTPPTSARPEGMEASEAQKLVRRHTLHNQHVFHAETGSGSRSGAVTPTEESGFIEDYHPRPEQYRGGILGNLLKLYQHPHEHEGHRRSSSNLPKAHMRSYSGDTAIYSAEPTPNNSPPRSGASTPDHRRSGSSRHWYSPKHRSPSSSSLAQLIGSSSALGSPSVTGLGEQVQQRLKEQQKEAEKRKALGKKSRSGSAINALYKKSRPKIADEIRITVHIAETIARQKYLMKLCRALMQYGAPTHRLEEYMSMSSRVLEIEAQFLYIPGSMIMSFDDPTTHTTEVKLVKVAQGLDLGKLRDVHEVYKEVVHDRIGVEDATARLKEVTSRKPKHSTWVRIPIYGLASVCVGPFAFGARLIDLPIAFILGCLVGILQLVVAPRSDLYANVFEIGAAVITSFLARAFGSIRGGDLFCFSALAQSSIALILPGYIVLCASLELQSRSIVAGSVRMVYAIIYSLFLGFGITIGTAIYGIIDRNAVSSTTCKNQISGHWFFFFVPGFTMCLIIINQAKWKQAPMMMFIAFVGYIVNFFSSERFSGNSQVSNTLGAFAIGVIANLYSRIGSRIENRALDLWEDRLRPRWKSFKRSVLHIKPRKDKHLDPPTKLESHGHSHANSDAESTFVRQTRRVGYGLAAAAMLPAIFVQVPSGLAVSGSLVSGITSADQITGNATNGSSTLDAAAIAAGGGLNSIAFNVGYSVIQVAIGITVGLFLSAIVVYPFGKKRSGLFSF
ncbi:hypothetical protein WHR41_05962 [Cladosporium halotolerans]|uniref:Threonine/serine exporter-like N-terminal domain-containing protein n=1 Tax=Cladosporium halotolerans TaxID=1052096 RepID=A0AB34KQU2_9PEZI